MMSVRILSKHVSKTAGQAMFGAALLLVFLFILFTYIAEFADLKPGYTAWDAFKYVLWQGPNFLYDLLPVAALIGAVVGLGALASNSELIVMRASGVSIWRIVRWVIRPALLLVALAFVLSQWVIPYTNAHAKMIKQQKQHVSKVGSVSGYWSKENNRFIFVDYADALGQLKNVHVLDMDDNGHLQQTLLAEQGHFEHDQQWQFSNVQLSNIQPDGNAKQQNIKQMDMNLALQPRFVQIVTVSPDDLSPSQLVQYMRYMAEYSQVPKPYLLAFWTKLASPFSLIALVVVACSFIFGPLRTQTVGFRLVIALFIGLTFHYFQDFLGYASLVYSPSPMWFVVLPIVICFLIGVYLLRRIG